MGKSEAFIIIEKGEPFGQGEVVSLTAGQMLVGRCWETIHPDIAFSNPYISKRHALIEAQHGRFMITDLASKHGTTVNGMDIGFSRPHVLGNKDRISLAKGSVILIFNQIGKSNSGETINFTDFSPYVEENILGNLVIHSERREVLRDGKPLQLVGKEMELFLLLYQYRQKAVSYDEIKVKVWPERLMADKQPDVGNEEINVLVYRLRRRLGIYGRIIVAIPRHGYMLDLF